MAPSLRALPLYLFCALAACNIFVCAIRPPWPPLAPDPDVLSTVFNAAPPVFDITSFGAVGDNATINTAAIQKAVSAASAAGGGLVRVPPGGTFKTATVSLASNVYLYLPDGAVLLGSSNQSDYLAVSGGNWDRWDVLHTNNCTSCGIIGDVGGNGTLQGPMWQMIASYDPSENQLEPVMWSGGSYGCEGECRPRLVVFEDCSDVVLTNVRLTDSSDWTSLFRRVVGVTWENVTVWGSQQWPNNDGCDLESVTSAYFNNVNIFTGDDGICLASGNTNNMLHPWPEPEGSYTPTTDVLVENSVISSYSSAFKLEAIFQKSHGNISNILVRNTQMRASNRGIGMQQRTGSGAFRNITFSNVTVEARAIIGSNWWGDGEAIWLTSVPESETPAEPLGGIHGVVFQNVFTASEQGVVVVCRDGDDNPAAPNHCAAGSSSPAIDGLVFSNVSVTIGVLGNATRPGVHDLRPIDSSSPVPQQPQANVTGFWFEHVGGAQITGGGVFFAGPAQPFWAKGTCVGTTSDSTVSMVQLGCDPAA